MQCTSHAGTVGTAAQQLQLTFGLIPTGRVSSLQALIHQISILYFLERVDQFNEFLSIFQFLGSNTQCCVLLGKVFLCFKYIYIFRAAVAVL